MSDDRTIEGRSSADIRPADGLSTATIAGAGAQQGERRSQDAVQDTSQASGSAPLFPEREAAELRTQWDMVQTSFVDEPRRSVEQADALVASAMQRLAQIFAQERSELEAQWDRGDQVSTEDLRIALQRYRSFFTRLLSM